jgi:hypothetical protein
VQSSSQPRANSVGSGPRHADDIAVSIGNQSDSLKSIGNKERVPVNAYKLTYDMTYISLLYAVDFVLDLAGDLLRLTHKRTAIGEEEAPCFASGRRY